MVSKINRCTRYVLNNCINVLLHFQPKYLHHKLHPLEFNWVNFSSIVGLYCFTVYSSTRYVCFGTSYKIQCYDSEEFKARWDPVISVEIVYNCVEMIILEMKKIKVWQN